MILLSTDAGFLNILILLDLTAAFDTVNHNLLISRLSSVGITGLALQWLQSYLADRHQYISMGSHKSGIAPVDRGVPQGSVLGPLLFIIYISPLGQIIRNHGFNFHCYADDIQIYVSTTSLSASAQAFSSCVRDLKIWLQNNYLKLNADKTEVLLVGAKTSLSQVLNF